MSGETSGLSGSRLPGSTPSTPKAIGSLAKKQSDVTRQGTQKLKFTPTLPARRKKDAEVKQALMQEPASTPAKGHTDRGRGRGRGRGEGRGGPPAEMIASGPFAMGPAALSQPVRRGTPHSNFAPIATGGTKPSSLGSGLSQAGPPELKTEKGKEIANEPPSDHEDKYSDPEDGVEIIDMSHIRNMDWMAPESLRNDSSQGRRKKVVKVKIKEEDPIADEVAQQMDIEEAAAKGEVNLANALDLSESEDEEELESVMRDFTLQAEDDQDTNFRQERLYFFQFPQPFPTFISRSEPIDSDPPSVTPVPIVSSSPSKRVTFAPDVKPPTPSESGTPSSRASAGPEGIAVSASSSNTKVEGLIGQLEIHQSGAVKMRLGNDILLDVTAAMQPSFLHHAVHLDMANKRLNILGEVNKCFVVSPDVDTLLAAMEMAEQANGTAAGLEEDLIKMDAT